MTQLALRVDESDSAPWSEAMSSFSVDSSHSSHIEVRLISKLSFTLS